MKDFFIKFIDGVHLTHLVITGVGVFNMLWYIYYLEDFKRPSSHDDRKADDIYMKIESIKTAFKLRKING